MNPKNWQKLNEIYYAALDCEITAAREQLLNDQCGDDADLRLEVENLLAATKFAAADDFLLNNAFAEGARILAENNGTDEAAKLTNIGNYRVICKLGQGGMGTVFKAERRGDFAQQVALKIIKRGMDSAEVIRRFEFERQILASLNHPNIARLLDGGTTADGAPFFVMEYVEGVPIDEFCQNLALAERLKLFCTVCAAVAYAHKNLVIHRDLKPSNILVTADGVPKLLDFGIAKLLGAQEETARADGAAQTATFLRMFTPDYASPEQVRGGRRLSTATDVYSLGICFYELLTDQRPFSFAGKSFEEILRSINETDPVRPSKAITAAAPLKQTKGEQENPKSKIQNSKFLSGDLDNISLKALRKEPEERYSSVEEFDADINRYLSNLPVLARPQTFGYRAGKYFKRHRVGVVAAMLVLLSLVAGLSVAVWQAVVARRERAQAEMRFNQVRKLANTVLFDYHERIKDLPGATETRRKLVTDALEYLDNLAQTSDDAPDLQRDLVLAYRKIAQIQNGHEAAGNTGETTAARENYQKALAIQEKLIAKSPASDADRRLLAKLYIDLDDRLPEAVAILAQIALKNPNDSAAQSDLASGWWNLAETMRAQDKYDEAIENYRQAGNIYEKIAATATEAQKRASYLRNAALIYKNIGGVFEQKEEYSKTLEVYEQALAIDRENAAANPNNAQYQLDLSFTYNSIASSLANSKDFASALENCQEAFKIQEKTFAADPQNAFAKYALARTHRRMGDILGTLGNAEAAIKNYQKSIQMFEEMIASDPGDADKQSKLAEVYNTYASFRVNGANNVKTNAEKVVWLREAQTLQKRGLAILEKLKSEDSLNKPSEELRQELQIESQKTAESLAKLIIK